MKNASCYLVSLFLAIGLGFPNVSFAKEKMAVMDLNANFGVKRSLAEAFSDRIRDEIRGLGDYEVPNRRGLQKLAKKRGLTDRLISDDNQCLIGFGRATATRYVIVGSISKSKPGSPLFLTVNVRLLDTAGSGAGVVSRVSKKFDTEEELEKGAKPIAALIMAKKGPTEVTSTLLPRIAKQDFKPKTITNTFGMKFVSIPAGTFMMGSPPDEPGRGDDEELHRVTLSKPFYIQTTEVTQGQWKNVMGNNPSSLRDCDGCSVELVSWEDAQKFIERLNQVEGTTKYRLPSEAEWEYASRAGTATPFHTGYCISTKQANYDGNKPISCCPSGENRKKTAKAGDLPPNPWGVYEMNGNVWEWCQDWKGNYPAEHVTDPRGPSSGNARVLRGGSWLDDARNLRSARRFSYPPDYRDYDIGFRVVKDY